MVCLGSVAAVVGAWVGLLGMEVWLVSIIRVCIHIGTCACRHLHWDATSASGN